MNVLEINPSNYPDQTISFKASFGTVKIRLKYNLSSELGFWTLTVYDSADNVISAGRRIKSGVQILPLYTSGFAGNFTAIPISQEEESEIGTEPWGITHSLLFIEE
jgi:hypothetical protein